MYSHMNSLALILTFIKPFTEEELKSTVTRLLDELKESNVNDISSKITSLILKELQPKTIDYKIILNSTIVAKNIKDNVKQSAGFLFTESTDGYYTLKFDLLEDYDLILNVIYVK